MKEIGGKYGNGFKVPSGVTASDKTGERGGAKKGIPGGKSERTGSEKAFDGGRQSGICYKHDRKAYK